MKRTYMRSQNRAFIVYSYPIETCWCQLLSSPLRNYLKQVKSHELTEKDIDAKPKHAFTCFEISQILLFSRSPPPRSAVSSNETISEGDSQLFVKVFPGPQSSGLALSLFLSQNVFNKANSSFGALIFL